MRETLPPDALDEAIFSFRRTAFRLEHQPAYAVDFEQEVFLRHGAGGDASPAQIPEVREWLRRVAERTASGGRIERVRVVDEPLTPYQAWESWGDRWNTEAGEVIRYLPRYRAIEIGLFPAAGPEDWWLLDDELLLLLGFDGEGRRVRLERTDDPQAVAAARSWRDLAVPHSEPSPPGAKG